MKILKLPNADNAQPGTSRWGIEVSPADLAALDAGQSVTVDVTLPISEPRATFVLLKEGGTTA